MFNPGCHKTFDLKSISLLILFLAFKINKNHLCSHQYPSHSSLQNLTFHGNLTFDNTQNAAKDFGNIHRSPPLATLHPGSVSDVSRIVRHVYSSGLGSQLTVAARGSGHSLAGQALAHQGIVVIMESLKIPKMTFSTADRPYVDVSAGELWIDILHESLKVGLAPKSWTDYLHLTVGGTLSNGGVSGQAFRHGPQINNVYQLQVVTGRGEVVTCSEEENDDLFYAVLGGLGQFGIITRARIALEPAPKKVLLFDSDSLLHNPLISYRVVTCNGLMQQEMYENYVKWIRALYSDFSTFTNDQECLIMSANSFDYIEGFVIINRTGLLNNWRSSFNPKYPVQANQFVSDGRVLFCLEVAKYFSPDDTDRIDQDVDNLLSRLKYIRSTLFLTEVSYVDFLDRVHASEMKLREKGLWEVPHPWLNLVIPKRSIHEFAKGVFGNIVKDTSNGPVLIYPVNKSSEYLSLPQLQPESVPRLYMCLDKLSIGTLKLYELQIHATYIYAKCLRKWWNNQTSLVTPEDDVMYFVAFLSSATPSSTGLESIVAKNIRILDFIERSNLGIKQYLPHYTTTQEWKSHFGTKWEVFTRRKMTYDPLAILAPGQRIFEKGHAFGQY